MKKSSFYFSLAVGFALLGRSVMADPSLRNVFKDDFLIGAALDESTFEEKDPAKAQLVKAQFDSISPGNVLKWDATEPLAGEFHFDAADRYVEFGERNGMFIIGHNLVWHSQVPAGLFKDVDGRPVDRDTLLARMHVHIQAVVGRYKGRIKGWDVVNEALAEDGTLRDSPWRKIIGDDYVIKAFQFAHQADPGAELYYNDYGIENERKRNGAITLIKKLQAAGVPIAGVGIQEHVDLNWPSAETLDDAITAFSKLGIKVMITELDVNLLPSRSHNNSADVNRSEASDPTLNPFTAGLPDDVQQKLANRYAELFRIYLRHKSVVSRVTLWGVNDGDSWLNDWPIKGRASYPLLFDRANYPKPAFDAVVHEAETFSASSQK